MTWEKLYAMRSCLASAGPDTGGLRAVLGAWFTLVAWMFIATIV
jgi:hypothetical protein